MQWPTNWRQEALRAAGIPVTQHALDVLSAWYESTPTQSWTNNPLGLPAGIDNAPKALSTDYAAFASHEHFRQAFKKVAHESPGKVLIHVLMNEGEYGPAWRAINALGLPGSRTESDYPSALLDMVEENYRKKIPVTPAGQRKSAGKGINATAPHEPVKRMGNKFASGANNAQGLSRAITNALKGLNGNG